MIRFSAILLTSLAFSAPALAASQDTDQPENRCALEGYYAGEIQKLVDQGSAKDDILKQISEDNHNEDMLKALVVYISAHPTLNFIYLEQEAAKDESNIMHLLATAYREGHPLADDPMLQELASSGELTALLGYGPEGVEFQRRFHQALNDTRDAEFTSRTFGEKVKDLFFDSEDNFNYDYYIENIMISSPEERRQTVEKRCLEERAKRLEEKTRNEALEQNPIFDPNFKPDLSQ